MPQWPACPRWADRLLRWSITPVAFRSDRHLRGWLHPNPRPRVRKPYPKSARFTELPPVQVQGTTITEALTPAGVDDTGEDAYLLADPSGIGWRHAWSCAIFGFPASIAPGWLCSLLGLPVAQVRITQTVAVLPPAIRDLTLSGSASLLRAVANVEAGEGLDEDDSAAAAYRDVKRVQEEVMHHEAQVFAVTTILTLVGSEAEVAEGRKRLTSWLDTRTCEWRDLRQRHDLAFAMSTLCGGVTNVAYHRKRNTTAMAYSWLGVGNGVDMGVGPYWGTGYGDAEGQRIHYCVFNKAAGGPEAPSMVLCGPNGSGKTTLAIQVVSEYLHCYGPDQKPWIRIVDPKGDYRIFVPAMGGTILVMTDDPTENLNIMDLPPEVNIPGMKSNPVREAIRIVTGFVTLIAERGGVTIDPQQGGILDQALILTYQKKGLLVSDDSTWKTEPTAMPLLSDLEATLRSPQFGEPGTKLADYLSIYASGSLSGLFNRPTTVRLDTPILCYDTEGLDAKLQAMVSYLIAATEWRAARRILHTRVYLTDEVTQVLRHPESARLYGDIASMGRFFGVALITNGQLPTNWLNDQNEGEGKKVWENAPTKVLMKQVPGESIQILSRLHNLTAWDRDFLEVQAGVGDFLLLTPRGRVQAHCDPTPELLSLMPKPQTITSLAEAAPQTEPRLIPVEPGLGY